MEQKTRQDSKVIIKVCESCLNGSDLTSHIKDEGKIKSFLAEIETGLRRIDSSLSWEVSLTSCLDICPPEQVAVSVEAIGLSVRSTTSDPNIKGLIEKCIEVVRKI